MPNYRSDASGKWEIRQGDEILVEPSKEHLDKVSKWSLVIEARQKTENEKRERLQVIKQRIQNRTATYAEMCEALESLMTNNV